MEMTAYCDSSPGAWREEVFESKLFNFIALEQYFHERTAGEWRNCPQRVKKPLSSMLGCAKNCFVTAGKSLHSWVPLLSLYSCLAYWEREIYEHRGDLVMQAPSPLESLKEDENPTLWHKASCCRDWYGPVWTAEGTARGDSKSENNDSNTITTIYIQAFIGRVPLSTQYGS